MGGYGVLRICYPICPEAGYQLAWLVCALGTLSMVYGALAAMAQKDFKRLVAYSSVSHMGYVLLGIGAWSAVAGTGYKTDFWNMGMNGAMFQMIAHGISSAGMFFLVGVVYDRVHHRDLDQFGGLFARMPVYSGISMVIFFAALGLPGLCGFIGEFFVVLGAWSYSKALAVVAASVVILTAGYILWTIQRVYLGPEYKGPHAEALSPMSRREVAIAAPLVALAVLLGVYPQALFKYTTPTVENDGGAEDGRLDLRRERRPWRLPGGPAVNFNDLVQGVVNDTVGAHSSLWAFRAELALCATIIAVLLMKTFVPGWKQGAFHVTMLGLIVAVCLAFYTVLLGLVAAVWPSFPWRVSSPETALAAQPIFTGALLADSFTVVVRGLLLLFAALWTTFTQIAGGGDEDDTTEFYVLMLGALVGMCLMISANHVLIVLLGVEMASVPCYVLAGYKRRQSTASEAALKYAVFGAGTAGVMLFGLSLLAGNSARPTCRP